MSVHDAAGGNKGDGDGVCDIGDKRHNANVALVADAGDGAAVSAGFDALDTQGVCACFFPSLGFFDVGGGTDDDASCFFKRAKDRIVWSFEGEANGGLRGEEGWLALRRG